MNSGMSSSLMPQLNTRDVTARYLPRVLSLTSRPWKKDFSSFATILIASIVPAIVFEELLGDLLAPGHLEVEYHALRRRAVLPKIGSMVLPLFLRRLHFHVGFIGLDVSALQQIALHHLDH